MSKGSFQYTSKAFYFTASLIVIALGLLIFYNNGLEQQEGVVECLDGVAYELMIAKAVTSPSCFTYYDEELGRALPGVIDKSKFTQQNLDSCFEDFVLRSIEYKEVYREIDTTVHLTLGETSIGGDISNPFTISKLVQIQDDEEKTFETLIFTFKEPTC